MSPLLKFRKNIYSQNGEDGVIQEILTRLGIKRGWFCEFGAWDGKFLSNTYALVELGWNGVEIEGDLARFSALKQTCESVRNNRLYPICAFVGHNDPTRSLDTLLAGTPIPSDFDLLSIDIDSTDFQVWDSLKNYQPKIVVIEVDSSLLPPMQKIASATSPQSSFQAMIELGRAKGYTAACHTGNVFFVRNDLYPRLGLPAWVSEKPDRIFVYNWVKPNSPKVLLKKAIQKFHQLVFMQFR